MLNKFLNFVKRPFVGDQTTARLAFEQYNGYSFTGIVGNGGQMVKRSLNAINPAGITPGPTIKPLDASVTGNPNSSPVLESLTDFSVATDGRSI